MHFTGYQRNSYEQGFIQMNIRHVDPQELVVSSGVHGLNIRGLMAYLDNDPNTATTGYKVGRNVPLGQQAFVGHRGTFGSTFSRSPVAALLGVVASTHLLGIDSIPNPPTDLVNNVDFWATIQFYGHTDRIQVVKANYTVADEYLFDCLYDFGVCQSVSIASLMAANTLTGTFTITDNTVAGETIKLDGTASTAGTWSATPTVVKATGKPDPQYSFLGYKYTGTTSGAVTEIPETLAPGETWKASIGKCEGFINCLGAHAQWR